MRIKHTDPNAGPGVLCMYDAATRRKCLSGGLRKPKNESVKKYIAGKLRFRALNQSNRIGTFLVRRNASSFAEKRGVRACDSRDQAAGESLRRCAWSKVTCFRRISPFGQHVRQWHWPSVLPIAAASRDPFRGIFSKQHRGYARPYPGRLQPESTDRSPRGLPGWAR